MSPEATFENNIEEEKNLEAAEKGFFENITELKGVLGELDQAIPSNLDAFLEGHKEEFRKKGLEMLAKYLPNAGEEFLPFAMMLGETGRELLAAAGAQPETLAKFDESPRAGEFLDLFTKIGAKEKAKEAGSDIGKMLAPVVSALKWFRGK